MANAKHRDIIAKRERDAFIKKVERQTAHQKRFGKTPFPKDKWPVIFHEGINPPRTTI